MASNRSHKPTLEKCLFSIQNSRGVSENLLVLGRKDFTELVLDVALPGTWMIVEALNVRQGKGSACQCADSPHMCGLETCP